MTNSHRYDLLILLKRLQSEHSFLSRERLVKISQELKLPHNEVYGVSTFYSFLSIKPQGGNVIRICKSVPCHLHESQMAIDCIKEELGISPGEVTKDGRFSFELTNCIGACDMAPAMMVNDDVHGNLTPEKISKILKNYT